jgi:chromosome segregation ATPase
MLADHEQVVKQLTKDVDGIRRALAAETENVAECERALGEHRRREQEMREEISGLHSELDHFTEVGRPQKRACGLLGFRAYVFVVPSEN